MRRIRYRIASWLLGYRPLHIPDAEGAYIVTRSGGTAAIVTAKTLEMEMKVEARVYRSDRYEYVPAVRKNTFSGTF